MSMDQIRLLSIDDLVILNYLSESALSVTGIAGRMNLSQPAVTQRIRKMEEIYGQKLITRKGRGVVLTPFGVDLGKRASAALEALQPASTGFEAPTFGL